MRQKKKTVRSAWKTRVEKKLTWKRQLTIKSDKDVGRTGEPFEQTKVQIRNNDGGWEGKRSGSYAIAANWHGKKTSPVWRWQGWSGVGCTRGPPRRSKDHGKKWKIRWETGFAGKVYSQERYADVPRTRHFDFRVGGCGWRCRRGAFVQSRTRSPIDHHPRSVVTDLFWVFFPRLVKRLFFFPPETVESHRWNS